MSPIRILCTADLHLGRSSSVVHAPTGVDLSAQGAWYRIVELALTEKADALVIAGDVFDSLASSLQERGRFDVGLRRLTDSGIPVVAVSGNHDHDALPAYAEAFPNPGFHLLGRSGWEARVVGTRSGRVQFIGRCFTGTFERRSVLPALLDREPGMPTVGVLHGDLAPNSPYCPITPSDLDAPADAWVLGHIHIPNPVAAARVPSAYPGSPQALDFGESGVHGASWLELSGAQAVFSPTVPISNAGYDVAVLDMTSADIVDLTALQDVIERRAEALREGAGRDLYLCIRASVAVSGKPDPSVGVSEDVASGSGSEWQVTELSVQPSVDDVFSVAADDPGPVGHTARILIGLLATRGDPRLAGREVDAEWLALSGRLVEASAAAVQSSHRAILGPIARDGYAERIPETLEDDEANERARRHLLSSSWELFGQFRADSEGALR